MSQDGLELLKMRFLMLKLLTDREFYFNQREKPLVDQVKTNIIYFLLTLVEKVAILWPVLGR